MTISLSQLDAMIGAKKQDLASAVEAKATALNAVDSAVKELHTLQSADSQDAEAVDKAFESIKAARATAQLQADAVHKLESHLDELNKSRDLATEQLAQEANLRKPDHKIVTPDANERAPQPRVVELSAVQKDHDMVSFFRAKMISKQDMVPVATILKGEGQYADLRNDRMYAAVTTSNAASVIPPNQVRDRLIELLRAATVIRQVPGVRNVPLLNGNLTLPRQSAAASAAYVGEATNIAGSQPTTDSIALSAKKLASLVVQTGEILRRSSPETDTMIRNDIVEVVSLAEDIQFIRGAGSSTSPKGLKAYADVNAGTQAIAANATVNAANVAADLYKLIKALMVVDTPMRAPAWIMHPVNKLFLQFLKNSNNDTYMFPEVSTGMLKGYPIFTTTAIPTNLGGGTNASEVYLFDASEFILADAPTMMLDMSDTAAYHDGTNVQAAFSRDEVVMRLIKEHDTQVRHPKSVAYLSAVLWQN